MARSATSAPSIQTGSHSNLQAWTVILTASLFFFYEFIQLNFFSSLDTQLLSTFHIEAYQLGDLSSWYFISNIIFLLPAGILLDRFSTRKIVLISLSICALGTWCFASASNFHLAMAFRFLTGIGSAFCFLSCIRLASRWFPAEKMALASGIIVTMAMFGGMVAQTPMTLLVNEFGWRAAVKMDAMLGIVILIAIFFVIKDYPQDYDYQREHQQLKAMGFWQSLYQSYFRLQNWLGGIYTSLLNLPIFLLGALWGSLYLIQIHHFSHTQASYVTSMVFIGTIIGAPLVGAISDKLGLRRLPMIIGGVISLTLILTIMFIPHLHLMLAMFLFFALGLSSSTQVISYPTITESNPSSLTATSVSVISLSAIGGGAIFQPLFGYLMDLHWSGTIVNNIPVYSQTDFLYGLAIMPIACILGLIAVYFMKETYCKKL